MKIEGTSNMVNILQESARNNNIVLQWKIKIASWMSLKSSEINDYSWIISAVLKSPCCSSSCCQAYFPSIARPINLWKLILKNILDPPEMNRLLSWNLRKQRENVSLVQYQSNSFPWVRFLVKSQQVRFFFFGLAFAFDRHAKSFASSCNACSSSWSSGTSVSLLVESITNLFDQWEILTQEWVLSSLRDQFLISTPY